MQFTEGFHRVEFVQPGWQIATQSGEWSTVNTAVRMPMAGIIRATLADGTITDLPNYTMVLSRKPA